MDTEPVSLIKPGLLISLKSTVSGGVQYRRTDLSIENSPEGSNTVKWETVRTIVDPDEHERAVKVRGKAVSEIRAVCASTAFGLLCPESRIDLLDAATARARAFANEHNTTAKYTRVSVYIMKARIASTDAEAVSAISEEVRSLLDSMTAGVEKADAKMIRDACQKAQQITSMLADEQVKKVSAAVEEARKNAREIVRRVEKRGEEASRVIASLETRSITNARMAFLDISDENVIAGEAMPVVNAQRFAVDLDEEDIDDLRKQVAAMKEEVAARKIDIE